MRQAEIPNDLAGKRLDQALSVLFPDYSRNRLQEWIRSGHARLNGDQVSAKHKVFGGEQVTLIAEPTILTQVAAEAIPLNIVFEDETVLIINKPPGRSQTLGRPTPGSLRSKDLSGFGAWRYDRGRHGG